MVKKVLTINYSDSSGEKGIQDDLRVFQQNNVFGFTVITSLRAINSTKTYINKVPTHILRQQLESVFLGGRMAAIKITAINSIEEAEIIVSYIASNPSKTIILEVPVEDWSFDYYDLLFPIATLVIIKEDNMTFKESDAKEQAKDFYLHNKKNCLIPFLSDDTNYLFYDGQSFTTLKLPDKNISAFITSEKACTIPFI